MSAASEHHRIVILGAGFAGLAAAIRCKRAGIDDFVVLERAAQLGGTWRDNTYPGCACDVPSHLYSLSRATKGDWSQKYSSGAEIRAYLQDVAEREGLIPHIRFDAEVSAARYLRSRCRWQIDAAGQRYEAQVFIAAPGPLSDPRIPQIEGIERFSGELFHSARYRHDVPISGRRVAVVGTGATAVQLVPRLALSAGELLVFQRTPAWVLPVRNQPIPPLARALLSRLPPLRYALRAQIYCSRELLVPLLLHPRLGRLAERSARRHLREQVADPALRSALTPSFPIGCKRILLSNDYYPALGRPNVALVSDPIVAFTSDGVRTRAEGGREREHQLDVVILATGFRATEIPLAQSIYGSDGRSLAEVWAGSPRAYLGACVPGFPSLYLLYGPNTNLGHTSVIFMIESQLNHLMGAIAAISRRGAEGFDVREDVYARYNARLQRAFAGTAWSQGACRSWYIDANGTNSSIWPHSTLLFHLRTRRFDPRAYTFLQRSATDDAQGIERQATIRAEPLATGASAKRLFDPHTSS